MEVLRQAGYQSSLHHFNHKLREAADLESHAVEQAAARLMIPFVVESAEVSIYAETNSLSVEEAARNLRYRFLLHKRIAY